MPSAAVQAGAVLAAIVATIALLSGLRRTIRAHEWGWDALFGASLVILTLSYIQLVVTYLDAWVTVTDVYRVVTKTPPEWAAMSLRITAIVLCVAALAIFVRGIRRPDAQINLAAMLLFLVMCVSLGSAVVRGDFPLPVLTIMYMLILLACVVAPRGLSIQLGVATACMVMAIASAVALVLFKDFSVFECVAGYKCGVLGFNFRGVLDNENALALYLALAIPFVYIAFGRWEGFVMSAFMCGLVLLTGSRSGMMAALAVFAAVLLLRPNIRRPGPTPTRSALLSVALAALIAVGIVVPLLPLNPTDFSNRAALWLMARGMMSDPATFFYGSGLMGWARVHQAGLIDSSEVYSVHNQWLHVMFSTGLIGVLLFSAAIATLLWQARNNYYVVLGCVLVPVFVLSVTERPWSIDSADWLTWSLPGALLSYPLARTRVMTARDDESTSDVREPVDAMASGAAGERSAQ